MGSFANTLFSVLLGWVQSAVSWLWHLVSSDGAGGLMSWVLENWLLLVILLCGAGVLIDLAVYLLRWQPYRVWRSFWQRVRGMEDEDEQPVMAPQEEQVQWVYATGLRVSEEIPVVQDQPSERDMQLQSPVKPVQRVIPARRRRAADGAVEYVLPGSENARQAYHQPYYPPQWHTDEQQRTDGGTEG